VTLRRKLLAAATVAFLAAAVSLMTADAVVGGDWPGWDEGWAVVAFPLGMPPAVAVGLAAGGSRLHTVASVTAAIWAWGGVVFGAWLLLG
jgi:hypothetical protein